MRLAVLALLALPSTASPPPPAPAPPPAQGTAVFRFEPDGFWLNLHHFLYVLGRAEGKTRDSTREVVARAPEEVERGLASLPEEERKAWREAEHAYAIGVSQKDAVFDDGLASATRTLAAARDAQTPPREGLDPVMLGALERAAPIYRKSWWPAHRQANREWIPLMQELLARHGPQVFPFILRAYDLPWPKDGYAVHLSAYANWAGAYSTKGDLLVMSTANDRIRGLNGLEILFHESMHQWDDEMEALLERLAAPTGERVPGSLSHALVFYTAGAAVKHAVPQHVPYGDAFKVWERGLQPLKTALDAHWKPYLERKGTRDEALSAILVALAAEDKNPG